ncbi:phosphopantetheine-binding protein [Actinocrispum wychmicini]|uniref:Phosphopantetheine binding protein n=1 Tax=Actinocrispum wychmicini TaxID=1213861 RepID=A0A4R2JMR1_9PSEU|nr:phosphopantetheine-binding protein [Actinocrispum wychmicini]TCO60584.1 phosphopantetheine binding protein [Actinocrispum wychmicini]
MTHSQTIKRFVLDEFLPDVGEQDLTDDYDLVTGGVIDSLGLLKLIAWIEERFELPVDDVELDPESFRTIDAIDTFISGLAPATTG